MWLDWLVALLAEELAPRPRRFRTSLRWTALSTIGVGLMAAAHVTNPLGPYLIWILVGPVPMMAPLTAVIYLAVTAPILAAAVPLAGILAESPWLMLPFIGAFVAFSTYIINRLQLGAMGLVWQVITLDTFYGVVFDPRNFGWSDASLFGGCAIALTLIAAFDSCIWPDPAEAILLESLAGSLERIRTRFAQTAAYYLDEPGAQRPPEPPATSEMPVQLSLLDRASAEGLSVHRHAVLLGAINAKERIHIRVDRLMIAAREPAPHDVRTSLRPELRAVCDAIAEALGERASETMVLIRTGPDSPASPAASRARPAMEALDARVTALRPSYINRASGLEIANLGSFTENLDAIIQLIERPLDEPPPPAEPAALSAAAPERPDPALIQYSLKVGLCVMIGFVIGLITQRSDLSTILTSIIVTGLPTYGASLRKTILRIVGGILGGVISLLAISIATPNFSSLPSYMFVTFVVMFISAYSSLSSGRVAYAGKQIGTTFLLVYAALSPSPDVYSPLWRTWGILLGTMVVTVIFFLLWPVYAGDSLLPRLRKVIRDTLAMMPGGAATSFAEIHRINSEITQVLSQILQVADDARLEGRRSLVDHEAVVQSAGAIRRVAHRMASRAVSRLGEPLPPLDDVTQAACDAAFAAMRLRLESWLAFYESSESLSGPAARALASRHSRDEIAQPVREFITRVEARGFARISAWPLEHRRRILDEIQTLRRLEFLMFEMDTYLASIPGAPPAALLAGARTTLAQEAG